MPDLCGIISYRDDLVAAPIFDNATQQSTVIDSFRNPIVEQYRAWPVATNLTIPVQKVPNDG
jgi:hypothetical protein